MIMCKSPSLAAAAAALFAADLLLHHAVQSSCSSGGSCWGQHGRHTMKEMKSADVGITSIIYGKMAMLLNPE